jgi:hypothetical protein
MRTIQIPDELYETLADQLSTHEVTDVTSWSNLVGRKLFIRTVTYHLVGKVTAVAGNLIELSDASWVADSGRFSVAIKTGTLSEVEPVGQAWVNANAVTDIFPWVHALPKEAK